MGMRYTMMTTGGIARIDRAVGTQPLEPYMQYRDPRVFMQKLEAEDELKRICVPVDPNLEITEICDRPLRVGGPSILFEQPNGFDIPVPGNLVRDAPPRRPGHGRGERRGAARGG